MEQVVRKKRKVKLEALCTDSLEDMLPLANDVDCEAAVAAEVEAEVEAEVAAAVEEVACTEPLPKQWPVKKKSKPPYPSQSTRVATIDNVTLMNELKRRGLLDPNTLVRPKGFHWSTEEDRRLEEAVSTHGLAFLDGTKSPWHIIAQSVGQRSYSACRKRWDLLHPLWTPTSDREVPPPSKQKQKQKARRNVFEKINLDALFRTDPADDHYGLMALEAFTDTGDAGDAQTVAPGRTETTKTLAHFYISGLHNNNSHISFSFPQARVRRWDERLLVEHKISMHQQRVTAIHLEMRARKRAAESA
mgnify:CR=1 FL=1